MALHSITFIDLKCSYDERLGQILLSFQNKERCNDLISMNVIQAHTNGHQLYSKDRENELKTIQTRKRNDINNALMSPSRLNPFP